MGMNSDWMGWNIYTEQKKTGWYLCTVEDVGRNGNVSSRSRKPPGTCWAPDLEK